MYVQVISLIERLHCNYHGFITQELDRIGAADIHSIQAAILLQIGDTKRSLNEIRNSTNYLGSNLSQIIKSLVSNGYLLHERPHYDHRIVNVWLSDKGRQLYDHLTNMHHRYIKLFPEHESISEIEGTICTLRQLEQFCIDLELSG